MNNSTVIKVNKITKSYKLYDSHADRVKEAFHPFRKKYHRTFNALSDVSVLVKKGETIGIIGRNGSGKSTLLQIICGILQPTSGTVEVNGRVSALLELGAGFNPEFTGRENVYINGSILGFSKEEIEARFDEIAEFADIGDFIEQPVKTYSSGMMIRLAFAVIAHVDADILVVDEALAVGDAFFTQKCMRFLRKFMKTGTILFVSHDTNSVKNFCNHALWLEKGQILHEGEPKEVCELYLEAFYEVQQGKSSTTKLRTIKKPAVFAPSKDKRLDLINTSNLRNNLQIFEFDPDAASFGKGGAQIHYVRLLDENEQPLSWVVGGERVTLRTIAVAHQELDAPIIGFYVKDRLGQTLFGDNTFLSYIDKHAHCPNGRKIQADFVFYMPLLPVGDYSITVAIANGTQVEHVQHHWIHDAVLFKSESSSVATGLIGIPMLDVKLKTLDANSCVKKA